MRLFTSESSSQMEVEKKTKCENYVAQKNVPGLVVLRHELVVWSTCVRLKLATGRLKQDDKSAITSNASFKTVYCVHRLIV